MNNVRKSLDKTLATSKKKVSQKILKRNPDLKLQPYAEAYLEALAEENGLIYDKMELSDFNKARENEAIGQVSHTETVFEQGRIIPRTSQLIVELFRKQ